MNELRRGYLRLLGRVAVLALLGAALFTRVFLITQATGSAMFPAVKDGDLLVAFRAQRRCAKNDVVVYADGEKNAVGRVAALGGDVVTLDESGILRVNGTEQGGEILYPTYPHEGVSYPYRVPEGAVFLLGDQRSTAHDSRDHGAVAMEQVKGKVITLLRRRGL